MKLREIAHIVGAVSQLDESIAECEPVGVSIDSRTIQPGELFFAIRGATLDGHAFVAEALNKGACAAVVSQAMSGARCIRVEGTLMALQALAHTVRVQWNRPVIGVTGSSGKTMTKELIAQFLAAGGAKVIKSIGNFNNAYGLPLSILQLMSSGAHSTGVDYAVLEMGMSAPGEIRSLCAIAEPDVGAITNVSGVHLQYFPSVEAIAEAKAELVDHVKDNGLAVLNLDDALVARMRFRRLIPVRTYAIDADADVFATGIQLKGLAGADFTLRTPRGSVAVSSPLLGRHNIYNALAAAAVADYYKVPLERLAESLTEAKPYKMRGEVIRFPQGFTVINDAYNSNPRALKEMVATICSANDARRRIVVAGEMLELGEWAAGLHRQCGREMAQRGVDMVIGVRGLAREIVEGAGEEGMRFDATIFCETPEEAARVLFDNLKSGDLALIKGSRGVQMERVIIELKRLMGETG
jgi:UDP-N-acetylmuramoyl-tripeptide--D-alanyl-D-alanine ligase